MTARHARARLTWLALLALAACQQAPEAPAPDVPPPAPKPVQMPESAPSQAELRKLRAERNRAANQTATLASASASASSDHQRNLYARVEAGLLARNRLRRDRVPMDAPITADTLTRNFIAIALHDEYSRDGADMVSDHQSAPLRRWADPVRLRLHFGAATDVATQRALRVEVAGYAARLTSASGHSVQTTDGRGNILVLFVNDDERRQIGPVLQEHVPGIPVTDVAILRDLDNRNYCTAFAYSKGQASAYSNAVVLIRAELPALLRTSCIHEELAQAMGLTNDDPGVRPSIFNDDEEFALLTRHDELLLQMLYDPRLSPGMTEAEAAPIVRTIAAELLGEDA